MSHDTHNEIMLALGEIKGELKGVNKRLDFTNGKVADHEKRIGTLDVSDGKQNLKLGIIGTVAGVIGGFILNQFR